MDEITLYLNKKKMARQSFIPWDKSGWLANNVGSKRVGVVGWCDGPG